MESDDVPDVFLRWALRNGRWERYEHPTRGETLTLQTGKFPILSIHNILVEQDAPVSNFTRDMVSMETVVLLLAKVAKLDYQVKVLSQMLPGANDE